MPTVLRVGSYRFFFYAGDKDEPEHVHVERGDSVAKIWLEPIRLENSGHFSRAELRVVLQTVRKHRETLLKAWHDYFEG